MRYHIESVFAASFFLALALAFGGFQVSTPPPADAHEYSADRFESSIALEVVETLPLPLELTQAVHTQLNPHQLKDLLYGVGFRGEALRQAWGTAMKESTGKPMAHNNNPATGDNSYGLFQINMIGAMGPDRLKYYGLKSNEDLFDPLTNAKIAYDMSDGGKNWQPWHGIGNSTLKWMQEFPN